MTTAERILACMLTGAVGDALGAPIEFLDTDHIVDTIDGDGGVSLVIDDDGWAHATDDTQMTLFTAEGLLRASARRRHRGEAADAMALHGAYLRWFTTQGEHWPNPEVEPGGPDGWLVGCPVLAVRRGPGLTCLSALESGHAGTVDVAINDSKGCGGVMRAAPAGFTGDGVEAAFTLGVASAAITHSHPGGYLPAGVLAATVASVLAGASLREALLEARSLLQSWDGATDTLRYLDLGLERSQDGLPEPTDIDAIAPPETPTTGWMGPDALGVAVWCALATDDPRAALRAAVTHGGDSDSIGAITGNLVGVHRGQDGVPWDWAEQVDLADLVRQVAADATTALWGDGTLGEEDLEPGAWRYPPW